ncbi:M24 family metallopeptidase [Thalassotalea sp. M1531]|uniref:Xaa-Pro aminopeptidase n=1 Tax=Thalassotalea algicola TaxID=2716224 RepID=A0A7Y0Q8H2_9GAMM|nr:aminopeptidase P N-terminal domain-containing protein [Thalassotalea algicola]NMP33468.1 M24 family metallopeptidase [Thalassotalea algicola]
MIDVYASRREKLLAQLPQDSVVILVGNTEKVRNKNILFPFRQDHDFYYFTGYAEPDAVAILRPDSKQRFVIFNQPNDEYQEVWFAGRAGQQGAVEQYGADNAYDIAELEARLPELMAQRANVYYSDELGRYHHRVFDWLANQRKAAKFDEVKAFRHLINVLPLTQNMRRVKDEHEVSLIRKAVDASVAGHQHLMKMCQPGRTEQQLTAEFYNVISQHGCTDVGYPTIMAAGNNACCLHYSENKDILRDGQMLLVDAGGDYQYYTADITRTYPVNGKFSSEQKDIYQLVLNALDAAITTVNPGASWNSMYPKAMEVLAQGLLDLGIITGSIEQVMEQELYKPFTLHKTGHWMGLDVHDVGAYHQDDGQWLTLEPNMVFTIEPGLYFPRHCEAVDARWRGMGVRIEDDILVTSTGCENLSRKAPRTIKDIESIMGC